MSMAEPKRQWTYIPPAWTGTQVEGTGMLPFGRYRMPDGTEQVSFGLPQPLLDAVRAVGYAGGREQDPAAPQGYVSQNALQRGAEGLAGSAAVGSLGVRAPRGALRSGAARNAGDRIRASNPAGYVSGRGGPDPQITQSQVLESARGQGLGGQLYRQWAEEAGVPFRSDKYVSPDAQVIYDKMFPKYGYNVIENPAAVRAKDGTLYVPGNQERGHVYRVEPPGMNSTEFYANPLAGAIPLAWRTNEDER